MARKPGTIHKQILQLLQDYPDGLTISEMRELLGVGERGQQHLDKRVRELYPHYNFDNTQEGHYLRYKLIGPKEVGEWQYQDISKTLRAEILHSAAERCQMCGRTIPEDAIKLHIDHKIPQAWGGSSVSENLWAICSDCNEGKKDYFSSFDSEQMKSIMGRKSVHERILYLLKSRLGEWIDNDLIEFVANSFSPQTDWRKRLRELRYPKYDISVRRGKKGKMPKSFYRLNNWFDPPEDLTGWIRRYERQRKAK